MAYILPSVTLSQVLICNVISILAKKFAVLVVQPMPIPIQQNLDGNLSTYFGR